MQTKGSWKIAAWAIALCTMFGFGLDLATGTANAQNIPTPGTFARIDTLTNLNSDQSGPNVLTNIVYLDNWCPVPTVITATLNRSDHTPIPGSVSPKILVSTDATITLDARTLLPPNTALSQGELTLLSSVPNCMMVWSNGLDGARHAYDFRKGDMVSGGWCPTSCSTWASIRTGTDQALNWNYNPVGDFTYSVNAFLYDAGGNLITNPTINMPPLVNGKLLTDLGLSGNDLGLNIVEFPGNPQAGYAVGWSNTTFVDTSTNAFHNPPGYCLPCRQGLVPNSCNKCAALGDNSSCQGPPITCTVSKSSANIGDIVKATEQNAADQNSCNWTIPDGEPSTDMGPDTEVTFSTPGPKTFVVTCDGNKTAQCSTTVNGPPPPPPNLSCQGPTTLQSGEAGTFIAVGTATGPFLFTANGGSPSTQHNTSTSFTTEFTVTQNTSEAVIVSANGLTDSCPVNVTVTPPPPTLGCSGPTTLAVGQSGTFTHTGTATAPFVWSATDSSPATGRGPAFSTAFNTAGPQTVTVRADGLSHTCPVTVTQPPPTNPTCDITNGGSTQTFTADSNGVAGPVDYTTANATSVSYECNSGSSHSEPTPSGSFSITGVTAVENCVLTAKKTGCVSATCPFTLDPPPQTCAQEHPASTSVTGEHRTYWPETSEGVQVGANVTFNNAGGHTELWAIDGSTKVLKDKEYVDVDCGSYITLTIGLIGENALNSCIPESRDNDGHVFYGCKTAHTNSTFILKVFQNGMAEQDFTMPNP